MDNPAIISWVINPNVWFIIGALVLGIGMMMDMPDIAIVLGAPAFIVAICIALLPDILHSWEMVGISYILVSIVVFIVFWRFRSLLNSGDYDVNDD